GAGERHHETDAVLGLGGEHHRAKTYLRGRISAAPGWGWRRRARAATAKRPIPAAPYLFGPMRKRLLLIGGGLVALAALVAGGGYIAYKAGLFRSTKTERGQTLGVNEASTPQAAPRARAQPSWPVFRYDAFRTGFNPGAHGRPPFSVVWKRGLYRDGYLEAPAVTADGVIVYASYGKSFGSDLFAADALKGRLLWHKHFRHP